MATTGDGVLAISASTRTGIFTPATGALVVGCVAELGCAAGVPTELVLKPVRLPKRAAIGSMTSGEAATGGEGSPRATRGADDNEPDCVRVGCAVVNGEETGIGGGEDGGSGETGTATDAERAAAAARSRSRSCISRCARSSAFFIASSCGLADDGTPAAWAAVGGRFKSDVPRSPSTTIVKTANSGRNKERSAVDCCCAFGAGGAKLGKGATAES